MSNTSSGAPNIIFTCADPEYPDVDAFLQRIEAGLGARGHSPERKDVGFAVRFLQDEHYKRGRLFFAAAKPDALEKQARDFTLVPVPEKSYSRLGVLCPYSSIEYYASPKIWYLFGRLTSIGFHVAHAELIGQMTYWDPVRLADMDVDSGQEHTRYKSNQTSTRVPQEIINRFYPQFRAAVAQIFASGLLNGLTDGALGLRLDDGRVLTTTTRTPKVPNLFGPGNLALVHDYDPEQNVVHWAGPRPPTSGTPWHWQLLSHLPDTPVFVHTHSRHVTFSSSPAADAIRTASFLPYGSSSGWEDIRNILLRSPVAILRAHGEIALGRTFEAALDGLRATSQKVASGYRGPTIWRPDYS